MQSVLIWLEVPESRIFTKNNKGGMAQPKHDRAEPHTYKIMGQTLPERVFSFPTEALASVNWGQVGSISCDFARHSAWRLFHFNQDGRCGYPQDHFGHMVGIAISPILIYSVLIVEVNIEDIIQRPSPVHDYTSLLIFLTKCPWYQCFEED